MNINKIYQIAIESGAYKTEDALGDAIVLFDMVELERFAYLLLETDYAKRAIAQSDSEYKHVGFALFVCGGIREVFFGEDAELRALRMKRILENDSTGMVNIEVRQVFSKVKP